MCDVNLLLVLLVWRRGVNRCGAFVGLADVYNFANARDVVWGAIGSSIFDARCGML
jgi:hypothetical protein